MYLQIVEPLSGTVFKAHCPVLDSFVAVKYLPPEIGEQKSELDRFFREARLMAGLEHPRIVKLHAVGKAETWHFLVMEYVEGVTLCDQMNRGLSDTSAGHIDTQLQDVRNYVNSRGIVPVHLSPDNVLVDRDHNIKVIASAWRNFKSRG